MCGRFAQYGRAEDYAVMFGAPNPDYRFSQRYNIAPSQSVTAARSDSNNKPELVPLRWGLIPGWSKGPDARYSMINARAETVHEKPAYRRPFVHRRCLIPAEVFFEWQTRTDRKQPFAIHMRDRQSFAMAGIWETWGSDEEVIESCSIIVTDANELIRPIHDRMPVIIPPASYGFWLDQNNKNIDELKALLLPYPPELMISYEISTRVNNTRNDGADIIEPIS